MLEEELVLAIASIAGGENMSGEDDDGRTPFVRLRCSSSCFIPGNGNNFGSAYFASPADAGGTGEEPPWAAAVGAKDRIDTEADGD